MSANASNARELVLTREFDAPRELVWAAYTEASRLKDWWGPTGFKMLECKVDLKPGGIFHYGMQAPNGMTMWGKLTFTEIVKPEKLAFVVSFSDEKAGVSRHPLSATWPLEMMNTTLLKENGQKTIVELRCYPINATPEEVKTFTDNLAGVEMGTKGSLDQLAAYLLKEQSK